MEASLESARRVFYLLIVACAALLMMAMHHRRADRHEAALDEIEDLRRHVFPLVDPANITQLDPARVPGPDCARALLNSPVWQVLGLPPSASGTWSTRARVADRSRPAEEWPARDIRAALQRNVGGACVLPDVGALRETMAALRERCPGCRAEPRASGDTLLLRWHDGVAGTVDTTVHVPVREDPQAGYGIDEVLRRGGKRSVAWLHGMAAFPALDTVPIAQAEPELRRMREDAAGTVSLAGLQMNEYAAVVAAPVLMVALLLYLVTQIGHITRIHRTSDPQLVETFPWMVLSLHRVEAAAWRLLIVVLPSTAVGCLEARVLRPDLDRPWEYPLGMAAAVLPTLAVTLLVLRRLAALDAARARYRRVATPLMKY
jgi:hypothetical protein